MTTCDLCKHECDPAAVTAFAGSKDRVFFYCASCRSIVTSACDALIVQVRGSSGPIGRIHMASGPDEYAHSRISEIEFFESQAIQALPPKDNHTRYMAVPNTHQHWVRLGQDEEWQEVSADTARHLKAALNRIANAGA